MIRHEVMAVGLRPPPPEADETMCAPDRNDQPGTAAQTVPQVPMTITIWDDDARRMAAIDRNLHLALAELTMKAVVLRISEPPLLSRERLLGRTPVLEIDGRYWSLRPGETISIEDCRKLLTRFRH